MDWKLASSNVGNDASTGRDQEEQSNQNLYKQFVEQILGYAWQNDNECAQENMDVIRIPRPKEPIHYRRGEMQQAKGSAVSMIP